MLWHRLASNIRNGSADLAGARAALEPYVEAGATILNLRFRSRSLASFLEQLEAVRSLVS